MSEGGQPLLGKRVVVTRARVQASEVAARVRALGAEPIEVPTLRFLPPTDGYRALDAALRELARFDWLVFTSATAVEQVWQRLAVAGQKSAALGKVRVAAVGRGTAGALAARGVRAEVVPERFVAEGLMEVLAGERLAGQRFLLPCADLARETLPRWLAEAGAEVVSPIAYRTVAAAPDEATLALLDAGVDYLTFASGSSVQNFVQAVGQERLVRLLQRARVVVIGPVTAQRARDLGLPVHREATEATIDGLIATLIADSETMQPLTFSPLTEAEAREIARWQYKGPWDFYNAPPDEGGHLAMMDPAYHYHAIRNASGELIGYCCFGLDARVSGFDYDDDEALDVGAGLRPDLTGQGYGAAFLTAILEFGRRHFATRGFRATIASWNERALRMAARAGFQRGPRFVSPAGVEFTVLLHHG